MSFLSLSAVRVASAGDEFPVDSFVFAEHSDSQCGVIPPELATCESSPFGSPLLRWVSNHQKPIKAQRLIMKVQATPLCCAQPSTAGLALYLMLLFFFLFSFKISLLCFACSNQGFKKNNKKNVKFNFVVIFLTHIFDIALNLYLFHALLFLYSSPVHFFLFPLLHIGPLSVM